MYHGDDFLVFFELLGDLSCFVGVEILTFFSDWDEGSEVALVTGTSKSLVVAVAATGAVTSGRS